jgi:hypothetical protein
MRPHKTGPGTGTRIPRRHHLIIFVIIVLRIVFATEPVIRPFGGGVMPALPWVQRQVVQPDRHYVAMASRLPLKAYRFIPGFLRDTLRIRRQLADTAGLIGYSLNAQLTRKTFWTFSVWVDRASLDTFAAADPHHQIIVRLRPRMRESRFEFFELSGGDLPKTWDQMMAPVR